MDELTILRGIVDSYPYPIVFVDDTYTIRFLNRYAQYHYYQERGYRDLVGKSLFLCHDTEAAKERIQKAFEKMKSDGKEVFVGVNLRNQRIYMQPVRGPGGAPAGLFRAVRAEPAHRQDAVRERGRWHRTKGAGPLAWSCWKRPCPW